MVKRYMKHSVSRCLMLLILFFVAVSSIAQVTGIVIDSKMKDFLHIDTKQCGYPYGVSTPSN